MAQVTVDQMVARLAVLVERKMRLRARDPMTCLRLAEKRLPYAQRKALRQILEAQPIAQNPKLARRLDMARLRAAERRVSSYLQGYDMADRRLGALLGLLGGLSFNLILLAVLVLGLLMMRGLV